MRDQEQNSYYTPDARRVPAVVDDRNVSASGQYLAFEEQPDSGLSGGGLDLRYYINMLFKHRYLIITVVCVTILAALFASLLSTRYYTATASIQVDQQSLKVVAGKDVLPNERDRFFIQTQLQVLKSRKLAQRVVNRLGLDRDANFMGGSSQSIARYFSISRLISLFSAKTSEKDSEAKRKRSAASKVMGGSKFVLIRRTRIIKISYTDKKRVFARRVANAIAESFLQLNLDRKIEASSYAKNYLEDQLSILKTKLEESERALVTYAEKKRIVEIKDKASTTAQKLQAATVALGEATSKKVAAEYAWKQALNTPALALSRVTENKYIEALRTKHVDLRSKYEELRGTFRPNYPSMLRLRAQITDMQKSIDLETKNIRRSLKASFEAAKNQEDLAVLQVEQLKTEVLGLTRRSIQYNILKREAATNRSLYDGLLNRYKEVGIAGGVGASNVSIVDRALLPRAPSSPRVKRNLLLALVLGLMAGVGLAFLREMLDDTVKGPEEVDQISSAATLGVIPATGSDEEIRELLLDPHSAVSEAYRSLATSLQFSTGSGVPKTLFITSARPSEGKSTSSVALSRHFANLGLQVLLVDCDLRNPSLHKDIGFDNAVGLSNYLSGGCTAPDTIQVTNDPNLMAVGTGPLPPNPVDLLSHPRMVSFLSIASEKFDLVIMDGPPVLSLADAPILSSIADGTVFVVAAGETKSEIIRGALRRLRFARGKIVGTVTTKFDAQKGGYGYGYGYGYGDEYSYGKMSESKKLEATN